MDQNAPSASQHIRRHPFAFTLIIIAGLFNSILSFLITLSIGEFFSLFFQTGSSKAHLLETLGIHMESTGEFYSIFIILLIVRTIISYAENLGAFRQGELYVKDLREKIFISQMKWEPEAFSRGAYGKYLLRYSNDLKSVQNYFSLGIMGGIKNFLFLITGLLVLSRIHLILTLIFIFFLCLVVVIIYLVTAFQVPLITESRSKRSSLLALVARSFSGFQKIKRNKSDQAIVKKFLERSGNLFNANMRTNKIESVIKSSAFFLLFIMIGLLLWLMTRSYIAVSASDAMTIVLVIMIMQSSVRRILRVPGYLNKGIISLRKIEKVLQRETEPQSEVEIINESVEKKDVPGENLSQE